MTTKELDDYLIQEAEYGPQTIASMDPQEKVDAFLHWEGIIGYTQHILDVVEAAYNVKLNNLRDENKQSHQGRIS